MWQHLFFLTNGSSCESANFFDRKYLDLSGTGILNLRIHAECSNHLSYGDHDTNINCHNNYTYVHTHASRYRRLYILNIIHINTVVNISFVFGLWSNIMPFVNVNCRVKSISTIIGQIKTMENRVHVIVALHRTLLISRHFADDIFRCFFFNEKETYFD